MQTSDFIPESEACNFTGVSPRTLQRFAEAGYLQAEKDLDGLCRFSRQELEALFGTKSTGEPAQATSLEPATDEVAFENPSSGLLESLEVLSSAETEPARDPEPLAQQSAAQSPQATSSASSVELETLKHLVRIQEKLLDVRDDEISDLKQQRDWLKQRIEKLEQKAERDQLLLLSESQTVKTLVALQQAKKSPVRLALEYFGFVQSSEKIPSQQNTELQR